MNEERNLDDIYREIEADVKKGSFPGIKYNAADIVDYGPGDEACK